jgi:hypothetical protein
VLKFDRKLSEGAEILRRMQVVTRIVNKWGEGGGQIGLWPAQDVQLRMVIDWEFC